MTTLRERFDAKYLPEPDTGCWLWTAAVSERGYGKLYANGRVARAHRVSWRLFRGPIPEETCVLHHCDVRSCVNPSHLFLGDVAANQADAAAKGRIAHGEGHPHVKLTEDEVRAIREAEGVQWKIGKRFGITQSAVSRIKSGESWSHLEEGEVTPCRS